MNLRLAAVAATAVLTTGLLGVAVAQGPPDKKCPQSSPNASATATATTTAAINQRCDDTPNGLGRR